MEENLETTSNRIIGDMMNYNEYRLRVIREAITILHDKPEAQSLIEELRKEQENILRQGDMIWQTYTAE